MLRATLALGLVSAFVAIPSGAARGQSRAAEQGLGKRIFFDASLSTPPGQSCASCHAPAAGFTSPNEAVNLSGSVVPGAVAGRAGFRKPPTVAYAAFSPSFSFDAEEGTYVGGQFWDGRAADLIEQAKQPFLNPLEMNNRDARAVVLKVRRAPYARLFENVYGPGSLDPRNPERAFGLIARALAAFESSPEVSPFSSKYDAYLAGKAKLTHRELRGLALYEGKANCAACHPNRPGPDGSPPLFTDFTYDNLGVPRNPKNPFYTMPPRINPAGRAFVDPGLGGALGDLAEYGKMKVPTLRNLDKRPHAGFVKSYMHNGAFKSLKEVVHFYNSRDLGGFPPAEVPATVNAEELGNLGLTDDEEDQLVAFLKTLSDGFVPPGRKPR